MDDVQESWDTLQGGDNETAADDSETGQVFSILPVPLPRSVSNSDVESQLMEEDTLPCCTNVYPVTVRHCALSNRLTGLEPVGDVCNHNESEIDYFPFNNAGQWKLARALLFLKRQSHTEVNNLAVKRNSP